MPFRSSRRVYTVGRRRVARVRRVASSATSAAETQQRSVTTSVHEFSVSFFRSTPALGELRYLLGVGFFELLSYAYSV